MKTYITHPKHAGEVMPEVLDALEKVSDIVCATMGPGGRNVTIHSSGGIITTKDGVTVTRYLNFKEPIANLIAMMAIDAASKTVKEVGDGTTTSVLLFRAIFHNVMKRLRGSSEQHNLFAVARGIDMAVEAAKGVILESAKVIVDNDGIIDKETLRNVAVISANGDEILGRLVADAVYRVGENGTLDVKDSLDGSTYVEKMDGYVFPTVPLNGFIMQGKVTNEVYDPVFFIADMKFSDYEEIRDIVTTWNSECRRSDGSLRPLVMIVSDIEGSALATMRLNASKMPIIVVKAPHFQGARQDVLSDIALVTGTRQVFSSLTGNSLSRFGFELGAYKEDEFGSAVKFVLHKDRAEIIRHESFEKKGLGVIDVTSGVTERLKGLKDLLAAAEGDGERRLLKERISRISSGIGIIYVGADSELELAYKKMVLDDAIRACFTALDGGVVPGGGNILLRCVDKLSSLVAIGDELIGIDAVMDSLSAPMRKIFANLFESSDVIDDVVIKAGNCSGWYGMTIRGLISDLWEEGVIDPAKVTISALKNSASVAKQLLLTDWFLLLEDVEKMDLGKLFYPDRH